MSWSKEIWTYLIVTLVAVLIWAWAASETRERKIVPTANIRFVVSDPSRWMLSRTGVNPSIVVEGPKPAVQEVERLLLREPLAITVPVNASQHRVNLAAELRQMEQIRATGATILSTDPESVTLDLEQIVQVQAPVKANLPGVTTDGDVLVTPTQVTVHLPESVRRQLPADFSVEAFINRSELDQLEHGQEHTQLTELRIPQLFANVAPSARIVPSNAHVTFTIRSRIRETRVESVRVQLAGPPEDGELYRVEFDPRLLRDLTVLADADISQKIESGDVAVIAFVHLRSSDKETLIKSKPVSFFKALVTGPEGTRYEDVTIPETAEMPVVNLTITPRTAGP